MSRPRYLLLSEIFPPKTGGSGRWFWEIYRRLPREDVVVAAGEDPRQEQFDRTHDVPVVRLPLTISQWGLRSIAGLRGYSRLLSRVRRLLRSHRVAQVHCGRCLPEGWVAWMLNRLSGIPYLCYVHGEELHTASTSREFTWMVRRVFGRAALVIANSRNTATVLQRQWRVPSERIRQLYPGVDTTRFVPAYEGAAGGSSASASKEGFAHDTRADKPPVSPRRLGWGKRPVVLTVGRLQKRKGHDCLIRALGQIRRSVPDVLYAIVGDGEQRSHLEELVQERRLQDHVQFLGEVDDATLLACYQQCDLFVLPNRIVEGDFEGFGMVLVEAQSCAKPVVAGDSGGTAETMRIPETGRLVDCQRPEALAEVIVELLAEGALRDAMGRAGRQWVVDHFDWAPLSRQARRIFENDVVRPFALPPRVAGSPQRRGDLETNGSGPSLCSDPASVSHGGTSRPWHPYTGPGGAPMKALLKAITNVLAVLLVLPALLLYWIGTSLLGVERAFAGWSQAFALLPGLTGVFLRRAFYQAVMPECGRDCCITFGTIFSHPTARIGRRVYVGAYCCLGDVTLEDDVLLGSHVSIVNGGGQHGFNRLDVPIREQPGDWPRITIGRDTWIGDRAVVLADVGRHCVIGAGSVVTQPIPDYAVAVGVPARVVRYRNEEGEHQEASAGSPTGLLEGIRQETVDERR